MEMEQEIEKAMRFHFVLFHIRSTSASPPLISGCTSVIKRHDRAHIVHYVNPANQRSSN